MKSSAFVLMAAALGWHTAHAQMITIADKTTLRPIEGVSLTSEAPKAATLTNSAGQAELTAFTGSTAIVITHVSYATVTISCADLVAVVTIHLEPHGYTLDEFVFSASRSVEPRRDVPEQITIIKTRDIAFLDQPQTADLLQNSGALFVQKSQLGGGSPVIRGFEANRVLLVVDGVRMNNAIYRAGHLQDIITVDQNALDRIEIISGPGSVMYGSDALGGVVHLMTRTPRFRTDSGRVDGEAYYRYATAANEMTVHAGIELRGTRIASYTSITGSDFGDLRQGKSRTHDTHDWGLRYWYVDTRNGVDTIIGNPDPLVQVPTAYKQFDLIQKIRFRNAGRTVHGLNFQFSTTSDVPRYDRLSEHSWNYLFELEPAYSEWYYGPQKRLLLAYTLEVKSDSGLFNAARITPSFQVLEQSRHSRAWGSSRRGNNIERVKVIGISADLERKVGRNELRYGVEYIFNDVSSEAYREHITTGEITYRTSRYPNGGSTMGSFAAYLSHTLEVNEHWVISEGLRFSSIALESTFNDTNDFQYLNGTVSQTNSAVNWRAGVAYMPSKSWRISALASTGFRAPNVDDMGKLFDPTDGTVIVPNTGLKPERTTNFELGISATCNERYTIEATGFRTLLNDAITVGGYTSNGQDSIDFDGMKRVTALVNKAEAYLHGGSGELVLRFNDGFTFRSGLTFTYGRIKTDTTDVPLDHVPPVYGRTAIEWNGKRVRAEVYLLYNGWKFVRDYNLTPGSEDNFQYATDEGTPSWTTLNIRGSVAITSLVSMQAAVENIGDMNYRVFASGISGPGRNYSISLRANF